MKRKKGTKQLITHAGHLSLERSYSHIGMQLRYFWLNIIAAMILATTLTLCVWKGLRLIENLRNLLSFYRYEHRTVVKIAAIRSIIIAATAVYGICSFRHSLKILRTKKTVEYIFGEGDLWKGALILMILALVLFLAGLGDLYSNVIMGTCFVLQTVEAILVTDSKKRRQFELRCVAVFMAGVVLLLGYAYGFCRKYELWTFHSGVSTQPAVHGNSMIELWQMSANSDFYHASLYQKYKKTDDTLTTIPGLSYADTIETETLKPDICTSMTPQGIAVTRDNIYISAYCHAYQHNTVIFMLDRHTRQFEKELILPEASHAGGLAYDTVHDVLWVSTRATDYEDGNVVSRPAVASLSQRTIDSYNYTESGQPIAYDSTCILTFSGSSFLAYRDGYLYAGTWSKTKDNISYAASFEIEKDGLHIADKPTSISELPVQVQSMAFTGNKVILACSYGLKESVLRVYKESEEENEIFSGAPISEIVMPQMLEQVYPFNNQLYALFESGSFAYRYSAPICMDRVPSMRLDFIVSKKFEDAQ